MSDWRQTAEECERCGAMCVTVSPDGWVMASELKESDAELRAIKAKHEHCEALLRRCHEDPGVAFTDDETATMVQLWKDVDAYFSRSASCFGSREES
jgi:hypothetical protein